LSESSLRTIEQRCHRCGEGDDGSVARAITMRRCTKKLIYCTVSAGSRLWLVGTRPREHDEIRKIERDSCSRRLVRTMHAQNRGKAVNAVSYTVVHHGRDRTTRWQYWCLRGGHSLCTGISFYHSKFTGTRTLCSEQLRPQLSHSHMYGTGAVRSLSSISLSL
jgi:hypothetical protein